MLSVLAPAARLLQCQARKQVIFGSGFSGCTAVFRSVDGRRAASQLVGWGPESRAWRVRDAGLVCGPSGQSRGLEGAGLGLLWKVGVRGFRGGVVAREGGPGWNGVDGMKVESNPKSPILRLVPHLRTVHEDIYNLPNILTFSRLLAAPLIGYLIVHNSHVYALALFTYAGLTDLLDGWIARRWHLQTVVGSVVDPMADKALMTVATVALAVQGGMPVYLAVIILGRDILLAISAIYYRYISLPPPKTFMRYWDFSLPSAEVHPTGISKANTVFQLGLIAWTVAMPIARAWGWGGLGLEAALVGMQYFVAMTTIWSGASYIYTKDAVKILTQEAVGKEAEAQVQKTKNLN